MNVCTASCPVVFDLDGTLIDSAPDIQAAVNRVLEKRGIPSLSLERVRSFIGGGVDVLWQKIIAATGLPADSHGEMVGDFMSLYDSANALTRPYPGVIQALQLLAERGHPLGICTNKPGRPTAAILEHLGLAEFFLTVVGGDSLPEKKPDPAPLRAAFERLGADPRDPRGFYVGDSEYDAQCANRMPAPFLLFTQGYRLTPVEELPHLVAFDDWSELPAIIARLTE